LILEQEDQTKQKPVKRQLISHNDDADGEYKCRGVWEGG
jgi:hypothetical protein